MVLNGLNRLVLFKSVFTHFVSDENVRRRGAHWH